MNNAVKQQHTDWIKAEAKRLGFLSCGISKAGFLEEEAPKLERWLNQNMHGEMHYMANHFDKRLDPTLLVDGAKSVISLLLNYYPEKTQNPTDNYKISKYAYGEDYHFLIKDKLKSLFTFIQEQIGEIDGRVFVDSAPVLDRAWAKRSGLGWIGKNSNLISKQTGSFFFIAELICDLDLVYDLPVADHCGTCTACIDACPTEAIEQPYVVNGSKCISYFTIELKDQIPTGLSEQFQDWVFGCDICQDVCPWNRFSHPHSETKFQPNENLLDFTKKDWEELTQETFNEVFRKSAVKRTKYSGFMRNIQYLSEKK